MKTREEGTKNLFLGVGWEGGNYNWLRVCVEGGWLYRGYVSKATDYQSGMSTAASLLLSKQMKATDYRSGISTVTSLISWAG